jgi:BON domain-containing protein
MRDSHRTRAVGRTESDPSEESTDSLFNRSIIMKLFHRFPTVLLGALLAVLFGCAATATKEGTGEYLDDSVITTKVKAAILNEPTLSSNEISVETFKGTVQLSGFVGSQAEIQKAGAIARDVKGVTSVKNDIRLKTGSNRSSLFPAAAV